MNSLAEWSDWVPLADAIVLAPRLPAVCGGRVRLDPQDRR